MSYGRTPSSDNPIMANSFQQEADNACALGKIKKYKCYTFLLTHFSHENTQNNVKNGNILAS